MKSRSQYSNTVMQYPWTVPVLYCCSIHTYSYRSAARVRPLEHVAPANALGRRDSTFCTLRPFLVPASKVAIKTHSGLTVYFCASELLLLLIISCCKPTSTITASAWPTWPACKQCCQKLQNDMNSKINSSAASPG